MTETKKCNQCLEEKPLDEYYSRFVKRKTKEDYIYYHPNCKKCSIANTLKWMEENPRKYLANRRRYDNTESRKERKKLHNQRRKENGAESKWRRENKDKLKKYQQRYSNKKHNIPESEWKRCKDYFGYCCAYCGMNEEHHKKKFKQQLHKEHVIHEGRDDIKNCVPSCKSCNGSKHVKPLNEWYNAENPNYTRERYLRIYQWLRYDAKQITQ